MASLKSITELPVAESAEGLNLIVNDNGAAKQIAASAVGAQADWAETDENSPAFVKNKPVEEWDLDIVITGTVDSDGNNEDPTYMINYINTYENIKDKIFNGISPKCKAKTVSHLGDINSPAVVESFNNMFAAFAPEGCMDDGSPEFISFNAWGVFTSPNVILLPDGNIPAVYLFN